MSSRIRIFLTGLLTLLTAALLAFAPVGAKPASGGYQLFEPTALADQHAIQLAALENFGYHAKIALECCNAPKRTDGVLAGDSYVPSGFAIIRGSTVRLDQSIITKNGEIIPPGSVINENGGAIKIVTPDGQQITGKTDNLIGSQQLALPPPAPKEIPGKTIIVDSKGNALIGDWSSTKKLTSPENALAHWRKHRSEFPEYKNTSQYVKAAQGFVSNPPSSVLTKTRTTNDDTIIYDPATNTFAVKATDGAPKTMFRPDPSQHGYPSNMDYFNAQ